MATFVDRLLFVPPPPSYGADAPGLVRVATSAGDTVAMLVARAPGAERAVLFLHGNAEDAGHQRFLLERYAALGVTAVGLDYPGYGLSTGAPSEPGVHAAADAALAWLGGEGFPPERVVAHGRSLGGGAAVGLAARQPVAGLILESTFTSVFQVMIPFGGLPGDRFRSLALLPSVPAPILIIHGTADEVVPLRHGERLFEAIPRGQGRAWWVDGAGHNDLMLVAGVRYWQEVGAFLSGIGP